MQWGTATLSFQPGPLPNPQNFSIKCRVQPTELRAVASFHWQWLNHNILSADMLSHGIQLWPIAKQQGYLWLSLIGWSPSTKLKGHIPGTQPEAKTGSSLFVLYFTLSNSCGLFFFSNWLPTLLCHSLTVSPAFPLMFPLSPSLLNYHSAVTLVPLLCNCIWNSKSRAAHIQRSPFLCGLHPGPLSPWPPFFQTVFSCCFCKEIWRLGKTISTEP